VNREDGRGTFSYRAGQQLGLPTYNYGVCSYSYASSILQLEDLLERGVVEQLEPSILLLGAGSWLVDRSSSPFYPTPDIQLAYPYVSEDGGEVGIAFPPEFISVKHAIGFASTRPYFDGSDKRVFLTMQRRWMLAQLVPRVLCARFWQWRFSNPLTSYELYGFVLRRLGEIARRSGAKLVVMYMPATAAETMDPGFRKAIDELEDVILVDGLAALVEQGVTNARLSHPDARAHAAYANAICAEVRGRIRNQ
jgi:hypothetical protein